MATEGDEVANQLAWIYDNLLATDRNKDNIVGRSTKILPQNLPNNYTSSASFQSRSNFIWSVADLLRGPYRPPQYERVMLTLTVLRCS